MKFRVLSCMNYQWCLSFWASSQASSDPGLQSLCSPWTWTQWPGGLFLSGVGREQQEHVGGCGISCRRMRHAVAYGPCMHVAVLLAADSRVPPQPVLTCLTEGASPCGKAHWGLFDVILGVHSFKRLCGKTRGFLKLELKHSFTIPKGRQWRGSSAFVCCWFWSLSLWISQLRMTHFSAENPS